MERLKNLSGGCPRSKASQETLGKILSLLNEVSRKKDAESEPFLRKTSRLPSSSMGANFDFTPFGEDARREICSLASLSFLSTRRNVIFIGPTGIGKTNLAQAIDGEACRSMVKTCCTALYELDRKRKGPEMDEQHDYGPMPDHR